MSHIFITGGTGLIGQALCSQLQQTHQLTVLTRKPTDAANKLGKTINYVSQITQVDFNQIDIVINLAGEPIVEKRWSEKQKQSILESRLLTTEQISDAIIMCQQPPHTFISGSAIGYYGRHPAHCAINEDNISIHNEFSHQLCQQWEDAALRVQHKTRVCLLRTGIVLSTAGGALTKMLPAFRYGLGGRLASGQQMMSWIHLTDMVNLITFIIEHIELHGPINATAPFPVDNRTFTKTLAKHLNRPAYFITPAWLLKILLGEMADLLIHGQQVLPLRLQTAGFQFKYPTLSEALNDLIKHN